MKFYRNFWMFKYSFMWVIERLKTDSKILNCTELKTATEIWKKKLKKKTIKALEKFVQHKPPVLISLFDLVPYKAE